MSAPVIHFQLRAADADRLARFYERVLGWSVRPATMGLRGASVEGPYRWVEPHPGGIAGGIVQDDHLAGAMVVVAVDDIGTTADRAVSLGARTSGPAEDLWLTMPGEVERFAYAEIVDPEGNRVGLVHR